MKNLLFSATFLSISFFGAANVEAQGTVGNGTGYLPIFAHQSVENAEEVLFQLNSEDVVIGFSNFCRSGDSASILEWVDEGDYFVVDASVEVSYSVAFMDQNGQRVRKHFIPQKALESEGDFCGSIEEIRQKILKSKS